MSYKEKAVVRCLLSSLTARPPGVKGRLPVLLPRGVIYQEIMWLQVPLGIFSCLVWLTSHQSNRASLSVFSDAFVPVWLFRES